MVSFEKLRHVYGRRWNNEKENAIEYIFKTETSNVRKIFGNLSGF